MHQKSVSVPSIGIVRWRISRFVFAASAFVLPACQTTAPPLPGPVARSTLPATPSDVYRVQSNDLLSISFLDEPQLTQQVRVDWQGRIELPWFAGKQSIALPVLGKTPSEIASEINQLAINSGILNAPRATVLVTDYAEHAFVVQGQVGQPGRYIFPKGYAPSLKLPEAVALAGGYTRLASIGRILVKRGQQVYKLNLSRMLSGPGEMFVVYPGDVITVPERIF